MMFKRGKSKKGKKTGEISAWRLLLRTKSGKVGVALLVILVVLAVGSVAYYGVQGLKSYMTSPLWPYKYPSAVPPSWAVKEKAPTKDVTLNEMMHEGPTLTTKVVYPGNPKATAILQYMVNTYNGVEVIEKYQATFNYSAGQGALPSDVYYGLIITVGKNANMIVGNETTYVVILKSYLVRPDGKTINFFSGPISVPRNGGQIIIYGNNMTITTKNGQIKNILLPESLNNMQKSAVISTYLTKSLKSIKTEIAKATGSKVTLGNGTLIFATVKNGKVTTLNGQYKLYLELYYFVNKSYAETPNGRLSFQTLEKNDAAVNVDLYELKIMGNSWGLFGTDGKGRPIGLGLLFGLPYAFILGFIVTFTSTFIGAFYGTAAGYWKDIRGEALMRVVDVVNSLPFLPILIALSIAIKTINLWLLAVLMIVLFWAGPVIIVRSMALQISEQIYVEAARAVGASTRRILFKHMFPQIFPYTMAIAVLSIPGIIITEASLAVLGFGDPSAPTWGKMLQYAYDSGAVQTGWWWVVLFPGLALVVFSATFLLIGRAMEPIVAPKLVK